MPFPHSTSLGRHLLARSTLAVALVSSLALYHQTVLTEQVVPKPGRWRADATDDPIASRNLHCKNKIIISKTDDRDREEEGEQMRRCWQNYFINNKI